jgi:hypothetical protein
MTRGILIALGGGVALIGSFFITLAVLDRTGSGNIFSGSGSSPDANVESNAQAVPILIPVATLTRGTNVEVGNWPLGNNVLHDKAGSSPPRIAEFDFDVPIAGKYRLEAEYSAETRRPVEIRVNGALITEAGLEVPTGGWEESFQRWMSQGETGLRAGKNTLNISTSSSLPVVRTFRFVPAGAGFRN